MSDSGHRRRQGPTWPLLRRRLRACLPATGTHLLLKSGRVANSKCRVAWCC